MSMNLSVVVVCPAATAAADVTAFSRASRPTGAAVALAVFSGISPLRSSPARAETNWTGSVSAAVSADLAAADSRAAFAAGELASA